jgi:hypothetical protein
MTRDELIEELKKYPTNAEVRFRISYKDEDGDPQVEDAKFPRFIFDACPTIELELCIF